MTRIQSTLLGHAVRYFAASQMLPLAVIHLGWVLLLAAASTGADAPAERLAPLGRAIVRFYQTLGGVGADGRGDETHLLVVWGKLAFAIYLLGLLWRWLTRRRETPWSFRRRLAWSTSVAAIGWGTTLAIVPQAQPDVPGTLLLWLVVTLGAFATTAWVLALLRLADLLGAEPGARQRAAADVATVQDRDAGEPRSVAVPQPHRDAIVQRPAR
jgi:hypothetical protein